ncbi:28653_t:CDS:2, partial [Dentiscutata erythropus]
HDKLLKSALSKIRKNTRFDLSKYRNTSELIFKNLDKILIPSQNKQSLYKNTLDSSNLEVKKIKLSAAALKNEEIILANLEKRRILISLDKEFQVNYS